MVNEGRVGEIVRCTGVLKKGDLVSPELDNNTVINWISAKIEDLFINVLTQP
jgi:hypothetical protein